jgi:hypothetical protein
MAMTGKNDLVTSLCAAHQIVQLSFRLGDGYPHAICQSERSSHSSDKLDHSIDAEQLRAAWEDVRASVCMHA